MSYRPTDNIELGAPGARNPREGHRGVGEQPGVSLNGQPIEIRPTPDDFSRCAKGGTQEALKACVWLALPRTATVAGRYKFLDGTGKLRGDIELDVDWENWGKQCDPGDSECVSPGAYQVTVDARVAPVGSPPDAGLDLGQRCPARLPRQYAVRVGVAVPLGGADSCCAAAFHHRGRSALGAHGPRRCPHHARRRSTSRLISAGFAIPRAHV